VRELRNLVQQQASRITEMQTEITEHKLNISEQKRELQLLKVRAPTFLLLLDGS
jgi:hypothetical protein